MKKLQAHRIQGIPASVGLRAVMLDVNRRTEGVGEYGAEGHIWVLEGRGKRRIANTAHWRP
jgi:hypothetical protein